MSILGLDRIFSNANNVTKVGNVENRFIQSRPDVTDNTEILHGSWARHYIQNTEPWVDGLDLLCPIVVYLDETHVTGNGHIQKRGIEHCGSFRDPQITTACPAETCTRTGTVNQCHGELRHRVQQVRNKIVHLLAILIRVIRGSANAVQVSTWTKRITGDAKCSLEC